MVLMALHSCNVFDFHAKVIKGRSVLSTTFREVAYTFLKKKGSEEYDMVQYFSFFL